jgi:hypothetical protein
MALREACAFEIFPRSINGFAYIFWKTSEMLSYCFAISLATTSGVVGFVKGEHLTTVSGSVHEFRGAR